MRFSSLRSRDFRLLIAGQAVSLTGSSMQQVAVVWQLYLLTGSPLSLGMLGLFRVTPILLLALGGGVASAFDPPARQALVTQLVPVDALPNAFSLYMTAYQIAAVAGPALGGAFLAWKGVEPIYLLDVISYLAVIVALLAMEHKAPTRGLSQMSAAAALEGLRFLKRSPIILSTMLLDFFATFLAGSLLLLPFFADQLLKVGPRGLGVLYAAQPLGATVAGVALSFLPTIRRQGRAIVVSVALYGVAIAVFGVSNWFPLSLFALAASGAADTVSAVMRQTVRQLLTPDELRGRMTSVNMMFFIGGPQLGEVEAGVVAKLAGVRFSVWSGGALCVLAAIAAAAVVPSLRGYEHGDS